MKLKQPLNKLYELKVIGAAVLTIALAASSVAAQPTPKRQDGGTAVDKLLNPSSGKSQSPTNNPSATNPKGKGKGKGKSGGTTTTGTGSGKTGKTGKTGSGGGGVTASNPAVPQRQRVVFNTGAIGIEILANNESIGTSDKNGKLTAYVALGEHQISARKYEQDLFSPIVIKVSNKETSFNVAENVAKGLDAVNPQPPRGGEETAATKTPPETTTPAAAALPRPVDAQAILDAYADPQKTDSITLDDWQAVYEQMRQNLALGETKNDIEGLYAFAQGQIELAGNNLVKAVNKFSAATVFLPDSSIAFYGLGNAHFVAGNEGEAIGAYNKAIQLNGKSALPHKKLGDLYLLQKRNKEAANHYTIAKRLGMGTSELRLKIAETQIENGKCSEAIKELEELEKEAPTAGVYIALSDCHIKQKRAVSAIEKLNKAIGMEPNSVLAHLKIGDIYFEQKEFGKAKEAFERAFSLDPDGKIVDREELQEKIERTLKRLR